MARVSAALRTQLGELAARDLEEYVDTLGNQWSDKAMQTAEGFTELRVELLRWSFVFWIGQVVAISSILALMLRGVLK
jgi:hypothetical protein